MYTVLKIICFLFKINKLSKYSVSLDLGLIFLTPNILCCYHWELPQWRTMTQWPSEQGHAMLWEDPCVWICLSLPMWGWPRLRHPCIAFSPTSVSNWRQTNRDRDHSLFIDNELLACFTPVQLRHICLCCLTTSPCRLKRPHCETFIEVYFSKWAPSWVRLSCLAKSNGKCDFVTSLSFVLEFVVVWGNRVYCISLVKPYCMCYVQEMLYFV